MAMEIERKFLVDVPPPDLDACPHDEIEQGYVALTDDGVEVRVRRRGERAFLTIKSGGSLARLEEELEIDQRRFESLWPLTEGRRLEKTRYLIPAGGATIELDVYRGRLQGLLTAEVEFASREEADAFRVPSWLGPEITEDSRYKNKRLAIAGLP
jgi:CYTH domain-containing protein